MWVVIPVGLLVLWLGPGGALPRGGTTPTGVTLAPGGPTQEPVATQGATATLETSRTALVPTSSSTAAVSQATGTPRGIPTSPPTARPTSPPLPQQPAVAQNGGPHQLGELWEKDGVTLNLVAMDVRTQSDYEDAAILARFRFFNKTGQKLLIELDWNDISVDDSKGNKYVDWEGGTTSNWVEAGRSFDFHRYYSRWPKEESRVPAGVEFVNVVVKQFARIKDAVWLVRLTSVPAPLPAPAPQTVKRVGEAWEMQQLHLTLNKLEIRSASDYEDAAIQAWFTLMNASNQRMLADVDFGYIYIEDSLGQRFMDFEGGGVADTWIEPGKSTEFMRYYSTEARTKSRVTRGAEFVVLTIPRLARVEGARWKVDIVR